MEQQEKMYLVIEPSHIGMVNKASLTYEIEKGTLCNITYCKYVAKKLLLKDPVFHLVETPNPELNKHVYGCWPSYTKRTKVYTIEVKGEKITKNGMFSA